MNSSASSSETGSFSLLDPRIQRWIWTRGWTSLRGVQERAIPALLPAIDDVILSAATSAGKTEAAFFPILTHLLQQPFAPGVVLSISPLKALINDQRERLTDLCGPLDLPVIGWHGDVPASRKAKFLEQLAGVLIITPESLEALFVNKGTLVPALAAAVRYIVVDELHSFMGTERGKQVQSLMTRLEIAAARRIPRVGLSATLGGKGLAAEFLRPGHGAQVQTIDGGSEGYELKLIVKGYVDSWIKPPRPGKQSAAQLPSAAQLLSKTDDNKLALQKETAAAADDDPEGLQEPRGAAKFAIAEYLFRHLRGSNNLVFPNSRSLVEEYADRLRRFCERERVPNEFWAHHGSLSRDLREESEAALKAGVTAATAICTTTLELGIDIGHIRSVAQIGAPPSVASLRQRLGRSGRRPGEPAILRCFCIEPKLTDDSTFANQLREGLVQTIAMVQLLGQGWVEPPRVSSLHASTLVQQILSVVAQRGGATASELWAILVRSGTFANIAQDDFVALLQSLGGHDLLQQDGSGALLPGITGEGLINHYDFYSAFASGEEFRLLAEGRTLGSLPITRPLAVGQRVIFGGQRWQVRDIDIEHKVIYVSPDSGGRPPDFEGGGGHVQDRVRQQMRFMLESTEPVTFLDPQATELLAEARRMYSLRGLGNKVWLREGDGILLLTWRGDLVNDALALLLTARGLPSTNEGVAVRISSLDEAKIVTTLAAVAAMPSIPVGTLKLKPEMAIREKWDRFLPEALRIDSFASSVLDLKAAHKYLQSLFPTETQVIASLSRLHDHGSNF